jgi:hypothetical protein
MWQCPKERLQKGTVLKIKYLTTNGDGYDDGLRSIFDISTIIKL